MKLRRWILCGLLVTMLALAGWSLAGCATNRESENDASIPWNTPKSWETGMPGMSGMMDRR